MGEVQGLLGPGPPTHQLGHLAHLEQNCLNWEGWALGFGSDSHPRTPSPFLAQGKGRAPSSSPQTEEKQPIKRPRPELRMRQFINPASFVLMLLVGSCHLWEKTKEQLRPAMGLCPSILYLATHRTSGILTCGLTCIHLTLTAQIFSHFTEA